MLPSFFMAHGAPTLALETNAYTKFLNELAGSWADRFPKAEAVVLFSAHWESPVQQVGSAAKHELIYDFFGFPDELYAYRYPAVGRPELADEIVRLLQKEGIPCATDAERGIDHGVWVPLSLVFPDARVPVIPMSVHPGLVPEEQYRIGRTLAELRKRNVLIIGSGGTVHNLRRLSWDASKPDAWAEAFDDWLSDRLETWDTEALFAYREQAPHAAEAVPTTEHFAPLLYAMGAADTGTEGGRPKAQLLFRDYQYGSLSLCCWQFD